MMPPRRDTALTAGKVSTVAEVIRRLTGIKQATSTRRGHRSGMYWFSHLYLVITENVAEKIDGGRFFADNAYLTALDVAFANRYLDAVRADIRGEDAPGAWRLLFDVPANGEVLPIQMALAGVNAHINFDLPFAVVSACRALRRPEIGWGGQRADYDKVNDIFAEEMDHLLHELTRGLSTFIGMQRRAILNEFATEIVVLARGAAWENAEYLWALEPGSGPWRDHEKIIDEVASGLSRALLVNLPG